jgi:chromosome segregation ATPase
MCASDRRSRAGRVVAALLHGTLLAALVCGAPSPVHAQGKKEDAAREQLRRAQQALRKAEADRAAALKEKQDLAEQVEKLGKDADAGRKAANQASARLRAEARRVAEFEKSLQAAKLESESLRKDKAAAESEVGRLRSEVAKLAASGKEQAANLEAREDQARRQNGRTAQQEKRIAACESANTRLHEAGLQCLARFEKEVLPGVEPYTQLKRVELENVLEQYRDRFDEQRLVRSPR